MAIRDSARPWRWRYLAMLLAGLVPVSAALGEGGTDRSRDRASDAPRLWPRVVYPAPAAVRRARDFAAGRGDVSFAVIGASSEMRGYDTARPFSAASATKALLLAAELRMLEREKEPLDSGTRSLLEPMITYSDNDAAGGVYAMVGDTGLNEVAERAGMRDFSVDPGFWGGAQVTAADMARFYLRLERNLGRRYRDYGMSLLAGITPSQRWGIPAAAGRGWRIWFKGGWRPSGQEGTTGPVTHQGALLEHRNGERLALAVLSNESPGDGAGFDAIEGITTLLLAEPPPRRSGWVVP